MQKLFRSLIAIGGLAGLAACGDDVSVTEPPPPPFAISGAPVTAISIGSKVQLSASEAATWTSSDATVASVDGTGLVTAVKGGVASITATATADVNRKATVTITVTALANATVSVSNITQAGVPGNPTVNVNNVAGSIDVNLNVVPGDQIVSRVEVLIDGDVACTQNLAGAQSAALSLAAASPELEADIVSCQVNTAAFDATTGVASFPNGSRVLSARAIIAGGSQVATPSTPLIFNNQSGVVVTITNTNGTDAATANNPATGFQWIGGGATVSVVGVSYVAGTTVASVTGTIFGKTPTIALTNGVGSVAWTEGTSAWSAGNSSLTGYMTSVPAGESFVFGNAVLSNGQPLVSTSPILNFGAPGTSNAAMPVYQILRLDNTGPGVASANAVAQTAITINPATLPVWVNASTSFAANNVGIPSTSTLNAADVGSDGVTVAVHVGPTLTGATGSCNLTGLTSTATGGALTETTVSTAYRGRVVFKDALGNISCQDLAPGGVVSGTFGADFVAPTFTSVTGPAANSGSAAPGQFAVQGPLDNASGFSATPLRVSIRLDSLTGSACFLGATSACNPVASANPFNSVGPTQGYYTTTLNLVDQALNSTPVFAGRVYLFDNTSPSFAGGISLPSVIAGAATNTFQVSIADNLDLGSIFGVVGYPADDIAYPSQSFGTFGVPFETSATAQYAVSNWIRCLNQAGDFASTGNQAADITLTVSDQANNTASQASLAFGVNAQACNAVGNSAIDGFGQGTSNGGDAIDLTLTATDSTISLAGATSGDPTSVTLAVKADVPVNVSASPFTRVDFFWLDGTTWRLLGTGNAAGPNQGPNDRTFTYSLSFDPASPMVAGALTVVAIGVDAQGDAVKSGTLALTISP